MEILKGHTDFLSAYEIADYPYGFRLRCKKRVWIEWSEKRGGRLMECTSNPKRSTSEHEVWNKPKAGTFARFGVAMFLDSNGFVATERLTEYGDLENAIRFHRTYGESLPSFARTRLENFIGMKTRYEEKRSRGLAPAVALAEMKLEDALKREAEIHE